MIYQKLSLIQHDLAARGIKKDSKIAHGNVAFAFRGIDDLYNALSPILAKHGVCILPRVQNREVTVYETPRGRQFNVVLDVAYDLVDSSDQSMHCCRVYGEAVDTSDKATNKAFTAAYKYMIFQMFCIPLESQDPDYDNILPGTITSQQAKKLRAKLKEVGREEADFCDVAGITKIEELESERFDRAMKSLEVKK